MKPFIFRIKLQIPPRSSWGTTVIYLKPVMKANHRHDASSEMNQHWRGLIVVSYEILSKLPRDFMLLKIKQYTFSDRCNVEKHVATDWSLGYQFATFIQDWFQINFHFFPS